MLKYIDLSLKQMVEKSIEGHLYYLIPKKIRDSKRHSSWTVKYAESEIRKTSKELEIAKRLEFEEGLAIEKRRLELVRGRLNSKNLNSEQLTILDKLKQLDEWKPETREGKYMRRRMKKHLYQRFEISVYGLMNIPKTVTEKQVRKKMIRAVELLERELNFLKSNIILLRQYEKLKAQLDKSLQRDLDKL